MLIISFTKAEHLMALGEKKKALLSYIEAIRQIIEISIIAAGLSELKL